MSQANTTNPTELDDLLRGRIHLSGNGIGDGSVIQGKTVTRMVLSDGLSANILRNVATLTSSGSGTGGDVPAIANVLVVNPAVIAGNPTRNGTLQLPFLTPADAITYALANAKVRPVIALAPGNYTGNLTIPEQLRGVDFAALVPSRDSNYPATITGDVALVSYSGSSRIGLHGVSLAGNVSCATSGSVPAQLTVVATGCSVSGSLSGSAVTVWAERAEIYDGPITASSGTVSLNIDRHTRKSISGLTITPAPSITLSDGPLSVAEGGDPGDGSAGTVSLPVSGVLYVDGVNGSVDGDGAFGNAFIMPSQAIAAAVSLGMDTLIVAIAPGVYVESISKPESIHRLVLTEFVPGVRANVTSGMVRITGNITCISFQGQNNLELNRINLNGNISSINPIAAPAQLNLHVTDCTLLSDITALQVVLYGHRTNFTSSASSITASSGYVYCDVDRETRKWIRDNGLVISPAPTFAIYDGPLTVAEGGDPGTVYDGNLVSDTTKQVYNYPDGRRVWKFSKMFSLILANGVNNTSVQILETAHGGNGTPYIEYDINEVPISGSYPVARVRVELVGSLPNGVADISPGGFVSLIWEGAITKNAFTGEWESTQQPELVTTSWQTNFTFGYFSPPVLTFSNGRDITVQMQYSGPENPPSAFFVNVEIKGTGRFVS